ncbi:hypothetical protein EYZ11_005764 [Aspergillus tanneri]|uniref:Uncharacterized protein n=1 Tax=Aspergillus tanneri TaxID=1220188 RepID=A0A4S3JHH0_9EURO|nr:hypothetical protein EYZ11_005764 [Aspergillus tanneri]
MMMAGLWLDDGTQRIEFTRSLQQHPWLVDPLDLDNEPDTSRDSTQPRRNDNTILQWMEWVETARKS